MKMKYGLVFIGLIGLAGCGSKADLAAGASGATTGLAELSRKSGDLVRAAALGDSERVQRLLRAAVVLQALRENINSFLRQN